MQRLTKILSILSVIPSVTLLLTGCSSTDESLYYPAEESSLHLRLSNTDIVIDAVDGKATIQIESNATWSVEDPQNVVSWISFPDGSSGIGNGQLEISCQNNINPDKRSALITIAGPTKRETVNISQNGMTVNISESSISFSVNGGSAEFALRCTTSWKIFTDQTWLSVDKGEGIGDGSSQVITVIATSNASSTINRKGNITIEFPNSSFDAVTIEVTQDGSPIPTLTIPEVLNRTKTGATIFGTCSCAIEIVESGVYYHTIPDFNELTGTKVPDATPGNGLINVELNGLSQGVQYYVRTFARTASGQPVLSDPISFYTPGRIPEDTDNPLPN